MKFKQLLSEVDQPKPKDEQKFKAKHTIEKIDDPNAEENQFTGSISKFVNRADYKPGVDRLVYESVGNGPTTHFIHMKHPDLGETGLVIETDPIDNPHHYKARVSNHKAINSALKDGHHSLKTYSWSGDAEDHISKMQQHKDETDKLIGTGKSIYSDAALGMTSKGAKESIEGAKKYLELNKAGKITHLGNDEKTERELNRSKTQEIFKKIHESDVQHIKPTTPLGGEFDSDESHKTYKKSNLSFKSKSLSELDQSALEKFYKKFRKKSSITESINTGLLKLDDGSSVSVSKQDADLLNKMLKDLNSKNKANMEKIMMTDKAGFNEILGFAREAL